MASKKWLIGRVELKQLKGTRIYCRSASGRADSTRSCWYREVAPFFLRPRFRGGKMPFFFRSFFFRSSGFPRYTTSLAWLHHVAKTLRASCMSRLLNLMCRHQTKGCSLRWLPWNYLFSGNVDFMHCLLEPKNCRSLALQSRVFYFDYLLLCTTPVQ